MSTDTSTGGSSGSKHIVIRKYANRRLYNTATAEFVTLSDLHVLVKDGVEFSVKDAKNGKDLTGSVLAQIIVDEEIKGNNVFPTDYLRQVLKLYGDGIGSDLTSFLEQSIASFVNNQQQAIEQMQGLFGGNESMEQLAEIGRNNLDMFQKSMGMFNGTKGSSATNDEPSDVSDDSIRSTQPEDGSDSEAEITKLKRELAEMQQRLDSLSNEQ